MEYTSIIIFFIILSITCSIAYYLKTTQTTVDNNLSDTISSDNKTLDDKINSINTNLSNTISSNNKTLDDKINSVNSNLSNTIDAKITDLKNNINTSITNLSNTNTTNNKTLDDKITTLNNKVDSSISNLTNITNTQNNNYNSLNTTFTNSTKDINDRISNYMINNLKFIDNISTKSLIYTNGKTNFPSGWVGGVRTFDLYASATIAAGDDNCNVKCYINTNGDGWFSNRLTVVGSTFLGQCTQIGGSQDNVSNTISDGKFDVNALCIVGKGNGPNRLIRLWDNVKVDNGLYVTGGTFLGQCTQIGASQDNVSNTISDGKFDGNALCIVGKGNSPNRWIRLWDNVKIDNGLYVNGLIFTNGKNNFPSGWVGGVRTFDIFASATIGAGDDNCNVNAYMNGAGMGYFKGNLQVDGTTTLNNLQINNNLQVNGKLNLNQALVVNTNNNSIRFNHGFGDFDYAYMNGGSSGFGRRDDGTWNLGLWVRNGDLWIHNGALFVISDKRIKNIIPEKNKSDLDLIDRINIYRYTYKKNINKINIGFIAQEVKEVLPDQVSLIKNFISNIMRTADLINNKVIKLNNHELKVNDKIKIYDTNNNELIRNITTIFSDNEFEIDEIINDENNKVFIYGKEVDDLHQIDYNSMFALSFSGVKELNNKLKEKDKQIEELNNKLKEKDNQFEEINNKLEKQNYIINSLMKRLEKLES